MIEGENTLLMLYYSNGIYYFRGHFSGLVLTDLGGRFTYSPEQEGSPGSSTVAGHLRIAALSGATALLGSRDQPGQKKQHHQDEEEVPSGLDPLAS